MIITNKTGACEGIIQWRINIKEKSVIDGKTMFFTEFSWNTYSSEFSVLHQATISWIEADNIDQLIENILNFIASQTAKEESNG